MEWKIGSFFIEYAAKTDKYEASLKTSEKAARDTADNIRKASTFDVPAPSSGPKGSDFGSDVLGGLVPVALQIQSAINSAIGQFGSMASQFMGQFARVSSTMIGLARRIDQSIKFPQTQKNLTDLRAFVDKQFAGMTGRAKTFGDALSIAIGGAKVLNQARNFMANLGSIVAKPLKPLKFDIAGLARGERDALRFSTALKTVPPVAAQAATSIKRIGFEAAAAFGFVGLIYKGVQALKGAITGAASLNETISKTKEVFGDSANSVIEQTERMAKAFGLPKQANLDAAASIGLIGKAAGYSDQQAAGLANTMAKLAADSTSFYDVPLDVALDKIRSGLVGEAEPMRGFGVLLSETAVQNEALRMGLAKSAKTLDERAKVVARASLIEKGLATASGDLERTQGSASNQFRKFAGTMENLATSIGTSLLPAVTTGINLLNEFATTAATAFESSKASFESFAGGVSEVFATIGVMWRNLPIIWEMTTLKVQEGIQNLIEWFGVIPANLAIIGEYIAKNWRELIYDGLSAVAALFQNLGKNIAGIAKAIWDFLSTGDFHFEWTDLTKGLKFTAEKFPDIIKPHLTDMQKEIDAAAEKMFQNEKKRQDAIKPIAKGERKTNPGPGGRPAKEEKDKKSSFDLAEFRNSLSAGDKKDDTPKKQLTELQKLNKGQDKLASTLQAGITARYA